MKIYIASKFENWPNVRKLRDALIAAGHEITHDWTNTLGYDDAAHAAEIAEQERSGVLAADLVIVMLPGGFGTHTEMGMALAAGKRILLCSQYGDEFTLESHTPPFYWHKNVHRFSRNDEAPETAIPLFVSLMCAKEAA